MQICSVFNFFHTSAQTSNECLSDTCDLHSNFFDGDLYRINKNQM